MRASWHHHTVTEKAADFATYAVPLTWGSVEHLPVLAANQFVVQISAGPSPEYDEFIVTVGYAAPPIIIGPPEAREATLREVQNVEVKPLARFGMSRARLAELGKLASDMATAARPGTEKAGEEAV